MSTAKLAELGIFHGDTVMLRGNKRKTCPAIALQDKDLDDGKIRMNKCIRKNLRVHLSDVVVVKPKTDIANLTKVMILPFKDSIEGL